MEIKPVFLAAFHARASLAIFVFVLKVTGLKAIFSDLVKNYNDDYF